jgi:tripartite-type tricarboxylate transporter receptor subunit TctC
MLSYNFLRDIAPVAGIMRVPNVMVVHPSFPAKTVPELIAYAKANPGKINQASPGAGTSTHMAGELFKAMTGTDIVQVQYRGNAPALTDLLAGQVQLGFDTMPASIEYIRAGKLRALAVGTLARSEALPDVPTVNEFVPGYESSGYFGLGVPKGYAPRNRRAAQRGDQCWPRRFHAEGAACGPRGNDACRLACRFRQAHRRRDREMGKGDQVRRHQAAVRLLQRPDIP